MTEVRVRGLTKHFGEVAAVNDLSFDVSPGVVTGFLGPNGAGKTTTMRLMLGLEDGGGETLFDGCRYDRLERPATRVGALLDARSVHPSRTARNHLRMIAQGSGIDGARIDEVLAMVGLDDVADTKPRTFSLGMHQRLGLAASLLGRPDVLLLDEPANGLDPQGIVWLRDFLRARAASGASVLVSSHLLAEIEAVADRVVVIGNGELIADDSLTSFITSFGLSTVRVRTTQPKRLSAALRRNGGVIEHADGELLVISSVDQRSVAEIAQASSCFVYELMTSTDNLEQSFLRASRDQSAHIAVGNGSSSAAVLSTAQGRSR
jgi:ABC-2 type transport system ATP-binding protein